MKLVSEVNISWALLVFSICQCSTGLFLLNIFFNFLEIIEFINKITNNPEKIDKEKIKKVLKTTSFEILQRNEKNKGFSEAISSREDKDKKIPFFNLGPKNNWKVILKDDLKNKIEKIFKKELEELNYL